MSLCPNGKTVLLPVAPDDPQRNLTCLMKVVLLNTKDGSLLRKVGEYTREIGKAKGFQTTAMADEFRKRNKLIDHNVALKFPGDRLDISFLKTYQPQSN
jgi:hypothetical protein